MRAESLDITRDPILSERRDWASERMSALLIPLLILLGFALRVLRLGFQPLWWDEGYSVWFATHPLPQLLALTAADIHPPLYYTLLRGWIGVFGPGPIALRMFSVVVGVLAIPLIYVVAAGCSRRAWVGLPRSRWRSARCTSTIARKSACTGWRCCWGWARCGQGGRRWRDAEERGGRGRGGGGAEGQRGAGAEEKSAAEFASLHFTVESAPEDCGRNPRTDGEHVGAPLLHLVGNCGALYPVLCRTDPHRPDRLCAAARW